MTKVEKVPGLTCAKCGGFRVMMTEDGLECEDCDRDVPCEVELSEENEYLIYQYGEINE